MKYKRIPVADLNLVSSQHIRDAVQKLLTSSIDHPFSESTSYDVITKDGSRLPPKAIFGIAATDALGFQVLPRDISGGVGTPCFRAIAAAGYQIVEKNEQFQLKDKQLYDDNHVWAEGHPKLVTHLSCERKSGLASKKKKAFIREHNRLFCEDCGLDPLELFGSEAGFACIEVHHSVPVSEMSPDYRTTLEDLRCLCANCHRVAHYELRNKG